MVANGYDGRHLFSYDGEFHYQGETKSPPDHVRLVGDKEIAARLAGSYFLSGNSHPAFNVWTDGEEAAFVVTYCRDGKISSRLVKNPGEVPAKVPVCVSGKIVRNPELMAQFCQTYPSSPVFACPVVDELAAFGILAESFTPRRLFFGKPVEDELPFKHEAYDEKLEGDAYGRMAAAVKSGRAAHNQIYQGLGTWPFYDRILTRGWNPKEQHPTFMVRSNAVVRYFPKAPVSAKYYAGTSVPVLMETSKEFRDTAKCDRERVAVLVASDYFPGTTTFMRFHHVLSGNDWVGLTKAVVPLKTMPLFRYNKLYRVPPEDYLRMFHEAG